MEQCVGEGGRIEMKMREKKKAVQMVVRRKLCNVNGATGGGDRVSTLTGIAVAVMKKTVRRQTSLDTTCGTWPTQGTEYNGWCLVSFYLVMAKVGRRRCTTLLLVVLIAWN